MNGIVFEGADLFAGAGGTTTGIENAERNGERIAFVKAAINHDEIALASHARNHKGTRHFTEDIRTFNVDKLLPLFKDREGKLIYLWASLECTNFSNAKGGLPRDADSRTLANHLFRYIDAVKPDYILIENVREFMSWGELDENNKPVSRYKGSDFLAWVEKIKKRGYDVEWRILNSADYGAHTSRRRLFMIFAKHGLPIVWPEATHCKKPQRDAFFDDAREPWRPVKEVLDLDDEGASIFDRKKPLVERTLKRIYAGLLKYSDEVIEEDESMAKASYLTMYYKSGKNYRSINEPANTVTTKDRTNKITLWIDKRYNGDHNHQSVNEPAATLTSVPKLALMRLNWLDKQYRGKENHQSINVPAGTLTANPKLAMMSAFIMPTNFDNAPTSLDNPIGTITANRKHHYLVNPQFSNGSHSVDKPCFTLIARMDKKPPSIVSIEKGLPDISVKPEDTATMVKIKKFMLERGIVDIKMRMLKINELKKITGLPEDYVLLGNQGEQKKFIGNAVTPIIPQRMFEAIYDRFANAEERNIA